MRRPALLLAAAAVVVQGFSPAAQSQVPAGAQSGRAVGSMNELMVDILYPASDAVFYISTRTPKTDAEWTELQGRTLMLAESANLLMMPSRARDSDRWMSDAKLLLDAGTAAFAAAKKKDVAALVDLNDALYQSCIVCHMHYRPNYGRR